MAFWSWLTTASSDASIDPTISWAEGMAPSSVNDSARAMMARLAEYRDDISGLLTTAGTSTAYTITTNQVLATIPNDGQLIAFSPHTVNGIAATLRADGGTTYPIQSSPGVAISAGSLVTGSPYSAKFSLSNLSWILFGFYSNPFNIPLAAAVPYFGTAAPNSNFALPFGQPISRTTYATLFALTGTTYGVGDGTTTFNIPDLRGRVPGGKDDMGGSAASRLTTAGGGVDGATLGAVGGSQNVTLAANQIPTITAVNAAQNIVVTSSGATPNINFGGTAGILFGGGAIASIIQSANQAAAVTSSGSNSISATYTNGSQAAAKTVMPAIICNYILRII